MNLPRLAVKRPVLTGMVFFAILIFGVYSFRLLPLDLLPSIEPPIITILTLYPGAGAEDVESKITKYVEKTVATVANVKEINSISTDNISVVTLQFDWGTDLNEAANDARSALELVKLAFPPGVDMPRIFKFSTDQFPVMVIGISAVGNVDFREFRDYAEDKIGNPLLRVPGVGSVQSFGAPKREMKIDFNYNKLKSYNLGIEQISNILRAENISLPAGLIDDKQTAFVLKVKGEFTSVEDIKNVVISHDQGKFIYLKDLATVTDTLTDIERRTLIDNKKGMVTLVYKLSGANTVKVSELVNAKLKELKTDFNADIDIIYDGAEFIKMSLSNLARTFLISVLLVMIVVLVFLRRVRASLVVIISIPFSLILAFFMMYLANYTINILSLSALAIAVGMVVDNSIVVLENVVRHIERGERVSEASVFGASEVGGALLASTLTTIAVFAPLFFLTGIAGILFIQLAAITTITIGMSLFVAMFLTPMLTSKLLVKHSEEGKKNKFGEKFFDWSENLFQRLDERYTKILNWAINHKKMTIISAVLFLVITLSLVPFIGADFMPESDSGQLQILVELPTSTSLTETENFTRKIHDLIRAEVPEIRNIFYQVGQSSSGFESAFGSKESDNIGEISFLLVKKSERDRSVKEIGDDLREKISKYPGITKLSINTQSQGEAMFGGGKPISIEVIGNDLKTTKQIAEKIQIIMKNTEGVTEPQISLQDDKLELILDIDREKASSLGLNVGMIAGTLRNNISGATPTDFRARKDAYNLRLRLQESDRNSLEDIENFEVQNILGNRIPLKSIATINRGFSPIQIDRKDQERIVKVEAGISGKSLGEVVATLQDKIEKIPLPPGVVIEFGGSYEQQQEAFSDLILLLLLSIVLVYIVMAAQFESFRDPFIIMFSIPFAFSGVLIGLFVFGETLNVISFIGIVMLVGIVVNNAIVLVDYINILREREYSLVDAILSGGRSRLRPVLMTAFTTMFGLLPLALSAGEGAETWRPLGASVFGGLTFATLITLIIVPVMYSIFEKRIKTKARK
ncbi:MAG: efflux RND transporter permease subunit [Bacteroidetes bacterium]|nr:efflux RND transporter permease subunit [Bacteroidota bacterium]